MKLQLIQIGNSMGIRIPKTLLAQCHFKDIINATVVDGNLVLSTDQNPRQGWEKSFKKMAQSGDDTLLDTNLTSSSFDKDEWEW